MAVITFTTDFGTRDGYVAAMKGVALSIAPGVQVVDVVHEVAPGDIEGAAFLLTRTLPYFPPGTVHVVVVDPGVGSQRKAVAVEAGGHVLVGPDNGVLSWVVEDLGGGAAHAITRRQLLREQVSKTFHGRDVFAPVGAHLASGAVAVAEVGPPVELASLPRPRRPERLGDRVVGRVVHTDRFGNLITNIPAGLVAGGAIRVTVGEETIDGLVGCYADADEGTLVALIGSYGTVELSVPMGSAREALACDPTTMVVEVEVLP